MGKNNCEISGNVLKETANAILFDDGGREFWLPKSQIKDGSDDYSVFLGEMVTLIIPEWLAIEKELV